MLFTIPWVELTKSFNFVSWGGSYFFSSLPSFLIMITLFVFSLFYRLGIKKPLIWLLSFIFDI